MKIDHNTYYILSISSCPNYQLKVGTDYVHMMEQEMVIPEKWNTVSIGAKKNEELRTALFNIEQMLYKNLEETIRLCQERLRKREADPNVAARDTINSCTDIEELRRIALSQVKEKQPAYTIGEDIRLLSPYVVPYRPFYKDWNKVTFQCQVPTGDQRKEDDVSNLGGPIDSESRWGFGRWCVS
jgi:hypothetical protein